MLNKFFFQFSNYYSNENSICKIFKCDSSFYLDWSFDFSRVSYIMGEYKGEVKKFNLSDLKEKFLLIGNYNHGGPYKTAYYDFLFEVDGKLFGNVPFPSSGQTKNDYYWRGYDVYWDGKLVCSRPQHSTCWICPPKYSCELVSFFYSSCDFSKELKNIKEFLE